MLSENSTTKDDNRNYWSLETVHNGVHIRLQRERTRVQLVGYDGFSENQLLYIDHHLVGILVLEILGNGYGNRTLDENMEHAKSWIDKQISSQSKH